MTRVGIVHLTSEQLELLSAMAERPDLEVVGAVHFDADSTPFKIAQVFAVPMDTRTESLRARAPDLIVVPEHADEVRREVEALGLAPEVLTTREAAARFQLVVDFGAGVQGAAPHPAHGEPAPAPASDGRGDGDRAAGAPPGRAPNLEIMLRDGLDDLLSRGDEAIAVALGRLVENWAALVGAEACAVLIEGPERAGERSWIVGGPQARLAPEPDAIARAVLEGIGAPKVYLRHEPRDAEHPSSPEVEAAPRRALAAFPLEAATGVLWFYDLRLPHEEIDDRLRVLRRSARRLGRLLALEGRLAGLDRDRSSALRVADLMARMTAASRSEEVVDCLRQAVMAELRPELAVFRLSGHEEPEVATNVPGAQPADLDFFLAVEEELARAARSGLEARRQPPTDFGNHLVAGIAAPLRHRDRVLGTVSIFRTCVPGRSGDLWTDPWSEEECHLLERFTLHAAGALVLTASGDSEPAPTEGVLGRPRFIAQLKTEVQRAERYSIPFLLTIIELAGTAAAGDLLATFGRRMAARLRGIDTLAHVGPRRFAVLNPHTDRSGGRVVLRAREILAELETDFHGASSIDVRANQIQFPADVGTLDELLIRLGD